MNVVLRAGLLGLASGARSTLGITAQVEVTPGYARRQPERALGTLWAKGLFGVLALAELVGDKLPGTPSRLAPAGLVPRVVLAGAAAVLAARAADPTGRALPASTWPAAAAAMGAGVGGAFLGHAWRGWAAGVGGRDWPGALVEDAAAITACWAATRP